jgi:hypothetical protein
MTAPASTQWNVRLDPVTSDALRTYLASPLLVGLPKGALAAFMTRAIRTELQRVGAWPEQPPVTPASFF